MPQCSVPGCSVQGGHTFPSDRTGSTLRRDWVVAIRRADAKKKGKNWEPGVAGRVCSRHFSEQDYKSPATPGFILVPCHTMLMLRCIL